MPKCKPDDGRGFAKLTQHKQNICSNVVGARLRGGDAHSHRLTTKSFIIILLIIDMLFIRCDEISSPICVLRRVIPKYFTYVCDSTVPGYCT